MLSTLIDAVKSGDKSRVEHLLSQANQNIINEALKVSLQYRTITRQCRANDSEQMDYKYTQETMTMPINWDIVYLLIQNGADVNIKDNNQTPLLNLAIQHEQRLLVDLLLAHKNIRMEEDSSHHSPLYYVLSYDLFNWTLIVNLLNRGLDINTVSREGLTVLMTTCLKGNKEQVKWLLDKYPNIDVNIKKRNKTALYYALSRPLIDWDMICLLIEHNAFADTIDKTGHTALYYLLSSNNINWETAQLLLQHGADISTRGSNNDNILLAAARSKRLDIVSFLVTKKEAEINSKNKGDTALHIASQNGATDILAALLTRKDININMTNNAGETPLMSAIRSNQLNIISLLLKQKDIDVNIKNFNHKTALMLAVEMNRECVLPLLLQHPRIDLNQTDSFGWTTLMLAIVNKHINIVKKLLEQEGIDINLANNEGMTALMLIIQQGEIFPLRDLLQREDINLNFKNSADQTPLFLAIKRGNNNACQHLLRHPSIDVKITDKDGNDVLLIASICGNLNAVKSLLQRPDVDINTQNNEGKTALMLASQLGHKEIVNILLTQSRININIKDKNGNNALLCSSCKDPAISKIPPETVQQQIAEMLLASHLDINDTNNEGKTALMLACQTNNTAIVKTLLLHSNIAINQQDPTGKTALILATQAKHPHIIDLLLAHQDIDINCQDHNGQTALMTAILNISPKRAGLLYTTDEQILQKLLDHPACDINITDTRGFTALMIASSVQENAANTLAARILLNKQNINIHYKNRDGFTAAMLANIHNNQQVLQVILEKEGIISKSDLNKKLFQAIAQNQPAEVQSLLEKGANVNAQDTLSWTPLMHASEIGNLALVKLLLNAGANVHMKEERFGWSALDIAHFQNHQSVEDLIRQHQTKEKV